MLATTCDATVFLSLGTMIKCMKGQENMFWSIKRSGEVLSILRASWFRATSLSTYDF